MCVIQRTIQRKLPPVITIRTSQTFSQGQTLRSIFVGIGNNILIADVTDHILIICPGKCIDSIFFVAQSNVGTNHSHQVPVSVDVFRSSHISTCLRIVYSSVTDVVQDILITEEREHTPLIFCIEEIIFGTQLVGERRFQSRITVLNIQRVCIIRNR